MGQPYRGKEVAAKPEHTARDEFTGAGENDEIDGPEFNARYEINRDWQDDAQRKFRESEKAMQIANQNPVVHAYRRHAISSETAITTLVFQDAE